jgi:V/A-type H+-transporting ATPase subunit E
MNDTLKELTDKIYLEGVEKGKEEAATLLAKAREEAAAIVEKAKADSADILQKAKKDAEELDKNTRSELKLFAKQSVEALKTEITNLVNGKIVADSVKAALTDKDFMQKVVLTFVQEWAKKEKITIETAEAEALTAYFAANAKSLLNDKVHIKEVNGRKADFTLQLEQGSYKITFGEEEFVAYFKEFLRPKLVELLF